MRIAEEVGVGMDPDPEEVDLNASLDVSVMPSFSPRKSEAKEHKVWPSEAKVPRGPSDRAKRNTIQKCGEEMWREHVENMWRNVENMWGNNF